MPEIPKLDDGMMNISELIRAIAEPLVNEIMGAQAEEACAGGNRGTATASARSPSASVKSVCACPSCASAPISQSESESPRPVRSAANGSRRDFRFVTPTQQTPQQSDLRGIDGKPADRLKNKRQIAELWMSHNAGKDRTYLDKSIEGSDKEELERFRKNQLSMQPGHHK